jgi:hypothetical protein
MDGNKQMNKKLLTILSIIMVTIVFFCGCQEQKALTIGEKSGKIKLQSSVVELYQSSYNINKKTIMDIDTGKTYEIIKNIEIKYLFKNIAGRPINIEIYAEFYNSNNKLVGISEPRSIYLPKDYIERGYNPQNSIIYDSPNVADVKYALLIVEEKI